MLTVSYYILIYLLFGLFGIMLLSWIIFAKIGIPEDNQLNRVKNANFRYSFLRLLICGVLCSLTFLITSAYLHRIITDIPSEVPLLTPKTVQHKFVSYELIIPFWANILAVRIFKNHRSAVRILISSNIFLGVMAGIHTTITYLQTGEIQI
jgi:hypothetical protein